MHFTFLLSSLLLISVSLAKYTIVCDSTQASSRIENAIQEAIEMAKNAKDKLADLDDEVTKAAFEPLFIASDVIRLTFLYNRVINIATTDLEVTFYCDSAFIDWSDPFERWTDTAYSYIAQDGRTKNIALYKVGQDRAKKPGASGSSFSTLGYQKELTNGYVLDFSNQAHIMVSKKRWDPPSNDGLDHRALATVRTHGLLDGYTALDQHKPLSETVLHELFHVVGGTVDPKSGKKKIIDDPIRPEVTGKIYGYKKCVEVNKVRDSTAAILLGASPLTRAECPMMLAKALYLQIRGQKTYWSTGSIDPTSFRPSGIPNQSAEDNKSKRREIVWHG
ncbi:hypothetical protein F4803DRAFT_553176 [Xylaria telfairii]|nr:hypothetical protein F4803DRAFT_553176 [Xylaria telfairii]